MPALFIILIIVGVILFGFSFFVAALKFLLWVGLIILVIGIIGWIWRTLVGRR
ncbi:hypothetical protein [Frondihabitans australicus]|uniref:DUF4175 domain-containing protein n=1 Tax=Frondihabitans australicus TaxID=386892 RepID=A0A495ID02_9MICO|nr:hypothetical protein [Frondihabitans australicus]RKR73894.1 hypothetical protein C8E83_0992 [Frondihabitans australicus]